MLDGLMSPNRIKKQYSNITIIDWHLENNSVPKKHTVNESLRMNVLNRFNNHPEHHCKSEHSKCKTDTVISNLDIVVTRLLVGGDKYDLRVVSQRSICRMM